MFVVLRATHRAGGGSMTQPAALQLRRSLAIMPGVAVQTTATGATVCIGPSGALCVEGIEPRLLAALLRALVRRRPAHQIIASLSGFPLGEVERAITRLLSSGVLVTDGAPYARAFHDAATRLPTPAHFLTEAE